MCEFLGSKTPKSVRKLNEVGRALKLCTIDQSEASATDLSMNICAATRKMVNYARVG